MLNKNTLGVKKVRGEFLIKCSTSWPYLISEFLVAYITIVASDWPRTFFTPKVFLFSISPLFVRDSKKML